ncbi:hypothetical protein [Desulfosarcina alkanivorans]|uniref:hypothetical protein n=1 Tax=Desulfosarcina alkanivorans TaxID=571177 RepID=UPI0012D2DE04|nr:hypothetical protein [Desulfosarcina alkanivorans]
MEEQQNDIQLYAPNDEKVKNDKMVWGQILIERDPGDHSKDDQAQKAAAGECSLTNYRKGRLKRSFLIVHRVPSFQYSSVVFTFQAAPA